MRGLVVTTTTPLDLIPLARNQFQGAWRRGKLPTTPQNAPVKYWLNAYPTTPLLALLPAETPRFHTWLAIFRRGYFHVWCSRNDSKTAKLLHTPPSKGQAPRANRANYRGCPHQTHNECTLM